jgi:hypothetical protein
VSPGMLSAESAAPLTAVRPGDYVTTERDLHCVEAIDGASALLEDCRSGSLIEMGLGQVVGLRRIEPDRQG